MGLENKVKGEELTFFNKIQSSGGPGGEYDAVHNYERRQT